MIIDPGLTSSICLFSLDYLDKQDTPSIPEGYTLSIAFACVLEIVKGLNTLVVQGEPHPTVQGWIEPDKRVEKSSDTGVGATSIDAITKDKTADHGKALWFFMR